MKGRSAVAVILILPVTACASLGVKTSGISGPVAWQAVEMNVSGNAVLGQNSSWYSFVLALKETSGSTITFTRVEGSVSAGYGVLRPAERVVDVGRWQLPPHGELRLGPFASRLICVDSPCGLGSFAPVWKIVLAGKDEEDHEIRLLIDVALPYEPR